MGCSASVRPLTTIQSVNKADAQTNTAPSDFPSNPIPVIEPSKQLVEISVQTDDVPIDVKTNQRTVPSRNDEHDFASEEDNPSRTVENEEEPHESIDAHINPRFSQDSDEVKELEWVLHGLNADQFSISNQSLVMSAGQVTPTMVVDAVEKTNDLSTVSKTVWKLLYQAKETNDATYLIRAYTAESNFYRILNRKLARQTLENPDDMTTGRQMASMMNNVFDQLSQAMSMVHAFQGGQVVQSANNIETNWTKLYLQAVYRLIMIPNSTLRYQGKTYRGMRLTLEELARYEHKSHASNKAITSTSKSRHVAQNFIDCGPRPEDMIDAMFIYNVDSYSALLAIDVHTLSLVPEEQEVLIMPGILFTVGELKVIAPYSVEIEMRSVFQELANGGFANAFSQLLSGSPDLD